MRFSILLLFFILSGTCSAQIFMNKDGEQLSDNWIFNPDFIRQKKIKSINGRFTIKRAGSPMRETNYWHIFEFDSLGRISQSYETRKDDGSLDTVWTKYFYNDKGLLIYQSVGTNEFFNYTTTVFDKEKRVVSIEEYNKTADIYGIPITKEGQIDRYSYEENEGKIVKTRINKQGTPYAKIMSFYNESGKLIRIEDRYIATNEGLISHFEYNKNGDLLQKRILTSKQGSEKETFTFKYSQNGQLVEKKKFAEDKLLDETQFIYNEISGFPSAILMQKGGSSTITILRIKEYEYY